MCIQVGVAHVLRHGDGCGGERRRIYTRLSGPTAGKSTWVAVAVMCMRCGRLWALIEEDGSIAPPEVIVAEARDRLGLKQPEALVTTPPATQP
jgi:hypothetical protein